MDHYTKCLKEFNKAFNIKVEGKVDFPSDFRFKLMDEESKEYRDARGISDNKKRMSEVIDAIGDMMYILEGTIIHHGLEDYKKEIFDIVHQSNFSKLDDDGKPVINGENGFLNPKKPIGKVLKSKNFVEPDFTNVLKRL